MNAEAQRTQRRKSRVDLSSLRSLRLCGICVLFIAAYAQAAPNLLLNPGLEETSPGPLPPHWSPLILGIPGQFTIDDSVKHEGRQSIRIDAPESTRLYLRSDPIAVAPGEKISAGAWVKCKDVPPGKGNIILIGEFTNAGDAAPSVERFGQLDRKSDTSVDWTALRGTLVVPPLMRNLRLRMGFSYAQGTTWWDDVNVTAEKPLVAAIDLPTSRLSPAGGVVPVTIINRETSHQKIAVQLTLDDQKASQAVELTAHAAARGRAAARPEARTKAGVADVDLRAGSADPVFTENRAIIVPPPLVLQPICPTHWCAEDGPASIQCDAQLAIEDADSLAAHESIQVRDSNGNEVFTWQDPHALPMVDGDNLSQIELPKLPVGKYTIAAQVHLPGGAQLAAEQPWEVIPRSLAKVTINSDGLCVYNGKPIFGIGMFNGGAHTKEMGEAGFTVNHAYNAMNADAGVPADDVAAKAFLDSSQQAGMMVMALIPRGMVFHGDWDGFRHRVRLLRNHPALLCWDEEEGIARGDMKLPDLIKMRQILREEDPNHPLMIGDMKDVGSRLPDRRDIFPADQMDVGMWWWYPFPLNERNDTGMELEGDKFGSGAELIPPPFLAQPTTSKPIWVGIQAYKKVAKSRYPTLAECRAQAYLSIIHGARGLMWYGGSVEGGIYLNLNEGHWDDLKHLATELHEMIPAFLAPTIESPTIEPKDAKIDLMTKQFGDRVILLACNRSTQPVKATFTSPHVHSGEIAVMHEDRNLKATAGAFTDDFDSLAVHVYELR